ncbi:unnamed protein product, partial [marine sediment metagenome]
GAADLIKLAMIKIDESLEKNDLKVDYYYKYMMN